jgi:large subunit ribosomal protein L9
MQVILREDVDNLGHIGDLVNVKPGYARNFLLPRGLAVLASDRQMKRVEHEKRIIATKVAKQKAGAEDVKSRLDKVALTVEKAVGENDKLFGSVTSMEIEALLKEEGFEVSRKNIQLGEPIKSTGVFKVGVKLHRDVTATIQVVVVAKAAAAE